MILRFFLATCLSALACAVLLYVCLATPIGPWAETITSLCAVAFAPVGILLSRAYYKDACYATLASGMAGIIATALAFSLPTLYFVTPTLFAQWMATPLELLKMVVVLVFSAASVGVVVARRYDTYLRHTVGLPFPIGDLVYQALHGMTEHFQALLLAAGSGAVMSYHALTEGLLRLPSIVRIMPALTRSWLYIPAFSLPVPLIPMFIAIGAVAGVALAAPLLMGIAVRLLCAEPLRLLLAPTLSPEQGLMSFANGLAAYGAVHALIELGRASKRVATQVQSTRITWAPGQMVKSEIGAALVGIGGLYILGFGFIEALFVAAGAAVCAYQLAWIGGKMGLAPLGRFATLVMVPFLLLFGMDVYKAAVVATYVEIAGGCAVDYLFGRVVVEKAGLDHRTALVWQVFGVVAAAIMCAGLLLLYARAFGLGSSTLCCQRAYSRALLIASPSVQPLLLLCGLAASYVFSRYKINSFLVLGGLLMPWDTSLLLIIGGFIPWFVPESKRYTSFYAGIFGTSSLWMLVKALW